MQEPIFLFIFSGNHADLKELIKRFTFVFFFKEAIFHRTGFEIALNQNKNQKPFLSINTDLRTLVKTLCASLFFN